MEYIQTKWELIYAGSDGELYTTYYPGFTKKKAKIKNGLKVININVNRNKRPISVAKEIALAFIPNPNNYRYVKEKDENQMNTHPDNLYWSKSNRMDYTAFAKKKEGTVYKSYVDTIIGDYIVTIDDTSLCTLSCNTCGDTKIVNRRGVINLKPICQKCIDYSLDIKSLSSEFFKGWDVLKENNTEQVRDKQKKQLIIKCKCCQQVDIINYKRYKFNKTKYKCSILSKKIKSLSSKRNSMKQRCYNKNNPSYKSYGGKGIQICDEWLNDANNFYNWSLANGFEVHLEIDRIDGTGNYEPDNCQYITKEENVRKITSKLFSDDVVKKIKYTDWGKKDNRQIADELGFKKERVKYGGTIRQIRNNKIYTHI